MRAVIQRVTSASVTVSEQIVGEIDQGMLVLLGVGQGDTRAEADYLAEKIAFLRIFEDEDGKMNLALSEVGGAVLVISQFTLYGDTRRGRRPGFSNAAPAAEAAILYDYFCEKVASYGIPLQKGIFQAHMAVSLLNDGPVTLLLDSADK